MDGVTYHNIYGNTKQKDVISVVGSKIIGPGDGIVPVESALAFEASSVLQVNANHSEIHGDPKTIQEVRRILYQNLIESGRIDFEAPRRITELVKPLDEINSDKLRFEPLVPYSRNNDCFLLKHGFHWPKPKARTVNGNSDRIKR